jgi:glutathione S-transferase
MKIPDSKRSGEVVDRQTKAIETSFTELDRMASSFPDEPTIGELAVVSAIGYLDLRVPEDGWRNRYPKLARWLDAVSQRPSIEATKPPPA